MAQCSYCPQSLAHTADPRGLISEVCQASTCPQERMAPVSPKPTCEHSADGDPFALWLPLGLQVWLPFCPRGST